MNLYLIRHAIAAEPLPGQGDDQRPLTPKGIERFAQAVRGLEKLDIRFQTLYHSPKLRAVQTAELLRGRTKGKRVVTPLLAQAPSLELLQMLKGPSVALVGHEPWLSELSAWLLWGKPEASRVVFKKGGVAHLEGGLQPSGMHLRALWTPRALRILAEPD